MHLGFFSRSVPLFSAYAAAAAVDGAFTGSPFRLSTAPLSVTTTASGRAHRLRSTSLSSQLLAHDGTPFSPLYLCRMNKACTNAASEV